MSNHAATASTAAPAAPNPGKALMIGLAGIALTAIGLAVSGAQNIAFSWLVGISFWTAIAIGFLLMILIHHIFDAKWSVVLRRQQEHGLAAFKWLALLFLPLLLTPFIGTHDLVWPWMNPDHVLHGHGTVAEDVLYAKKSGFLSVKAFVGMTVIFFGSWIILAALLRKASFTQDKDGDPKWTRMNRKLAAAGLPVAALTLTFAAIYWIKSLEYHWFSTMYGVWFFANCYRGALCISVIIFVWLYNRGDFKGILNTDHMHSIGQVMLALTIFWAYVTFSQYFLIWNANVPEETFWYNLRELNHDGTTNQWWYVGLFILFGHFVVPFCLLLSYRFKVTKHILRRIAYWILFTILVDLCYNILPGLKDAHGDAAPFLSLNLLWVVTSVVGIGGICVWAYLKSFPTTKLIPIRDPRIVECLTHHE
ncbi:MAG: hypothetical protein JSS11_02425 [Verrucomicrobia bacterium]|nr:hypothetical protein [Verrucomicrobiota bacterium]